MDNFEIPVRKRQPASVDVAPLLDMVFILLIFFVISSSFEKETGVEVSKPKAESAQTVQEKTVQIAITREGTIHMNDRQVDLETLRDMLKQVFARSANRDVILIADNNSFSGLLVSVVDACNQAGAKKVSIAAMVP